MATIRRILIAVVGLALMVDAAALVYIKFTSGPKPSEEKSKLVLWVDDKAQAKTAEATLKEMGYEPILKADKRENVVDADFRVVMKSTKKELLKPIEQILRQAGHSQLSYSSDGTMLYYGGFYKQKAEALRVVERIKAKEQLVFEVATGTKVVPKPSHRVILLSVPTNMTEGLIDQLREKKITIADSVETPIEPAEESSES